MAILIFYCIDSQRRKGGGEKKKLSESAVRRKGKGEWRCIDVVGPRRGGCREGEGKGGSVPARERKKEGREHRWMSDELTVVVVRGRKGEPKETVNEVCEKGEEGEVPA